MRAETIGEKRANRLLESFWRHSIHDTPARSRSWTESVAPGFRTSKSLPGVAGKPFFELTDGFLEARPVRNIRCIAPRACELVAVHF